MTRDEIREVKESLKALHPLNEEIRLDKIRLAALRSLAEGTTQRINGMPHASGVSDKVGDTAGLIVDLEATIQEKVRRCFLLYNAINEYVMNFESPTVRTIIQLKYADGLSWVEVERELGWRSKDPGQIARQTLDRELESETFVRFCTPV